MPPTKSSHFGFFHTALMRLQSFTFSSCRMQTPPFLEWLVLPLWLQRFAVAPWVWLPSLRHASYKLLPYGHF